MSFISNVASFTKQTLCSQASLHFINADPLEPD